MNLPLAPNGEKTVGSDPLLEVERSLGAARQRLGTLADRLAELRARLAAAADQQRGEQKPPPGPKGG
jgi:hypothetical protein